jgi:hypothetical protein
MKAQSLTVAILALGLVAGNVGLAEAAGSSRDSAGANNRESSGSQDNTGYLSGPRQPHTVTPGSELQPIWHGMSSTPSQRMTTPCKPDQLRLANGACHAVGPT